MEMVNTPDFHIQYRHIRGSSERIPMNEMKPGQFALMRDNYNGKDGHLLFKLWSDMDIISLNDSTYWSCGSTYLVEPLATTDAITLLMK